MADIHVKKGDTVQIVAELPRDLDDVQSVSLVVGANDPEVVEATLSRSDNTVIVTPPNIDKPHGTYKIEWKIEYVDGLKETIPTEGFDYLEIEPSLH